MSQNAPKKGKLPESITSHGRFGTCPWCKGSTAKRQMVVDALRDGQKVNHCKKCRGTFVVEDDDAPRSTSYPIDRA